MKLIILTDYRNQFYSSTRERGGSVNLSVLSGLFIKLGLDVVVKKFSEIDFVREDFDGVFILYQSSEDPGLHYKEYIEDILLGLKLKGAILIPDFFKFRAHHNKVFMEIYRDVILGKQVDTGIQAKYFGSLEDYQSSSIPLKFPSVLKPSEGSRSRNVSLLKDLNNSMSAIRKVSFSLTFQNIKREVLNMFDKKGYRKISQNRKKFIIQEYVSGLIGDYKVLVYSDKYFVLWRDNRTNDFRASGSGKLSFPIDVPVSLLNFARDVYECLDVPYISMDIAQSASGQNYLLEFQFLMFGQHTLEKSKHHFVSNENGWRRICEEVVLEEQLAKSVYEYISHLTKDKKYLQLN
ncbi:MAG: hypothetical protein UT29_C0001G0010 [Candidatus Yanofskybacteria bacterium GW2011_GWA1_39_13]|uniref:ATP-grasp domain-containing protein n=1 Tax=Yanofskybacteria sp. (strain GW2011_GWA1_39_13) TaxID=1619019 RepID=A0A0G0PWJ9_YANXG|nr:MAG: hypothetical protein UT29_C0001G0010 [Candidatus Yanofskybacteria bacterium GW2011_GWA1_39_13]